MKFISKSLIKKISLVLLGLGVIGGSAVGITKLVEHLKADKESIHPTFEVGGLNAQGRYEEDKSRLYTEKSFRCDGLQAKLDFDSTISYQFFYYDDLDNFIEMTETYTSGETFKPKGTYARCLITPLKDNDKKISFKEKLSYPSQLTIKVSKKQESQFIKWGETYLLTKNNLSDLTFKVGGIDLDKKIFTDEVKYAVTSNQLLNIKNYKSVTANKTLYPQSIESIYVYEFKFVDNNLVYLDYLTIDSEITLNTKADFICISINFGADADCTNYDLTLLNNVISVR